MVNSLLPTIVGATATLHANSDQLSLLPSAVMPMITGQSVATLCGWGVKAGMVHSISG